MSEVTGLRERPSPNHDARPAGEAIDLLVLHYTGMTSAQAALDRLCDPESRVSSHYVVEEDGAIWRLVAEERRAFHAGVSFWQGREALNGCSIGVEIVNPGHEHGYRHFPALQMAAVCELCLAVLARHPIPPCRVVAHSDIAPDRKQDPGELFDWRGLAENGVGVWPAGVADAGVGGVLHGAAALARVRGDLRAVGYGVAAAGEMDAGLAVVLRAFQLHWRPEAVTGAADRGTVARLAAVARLCGGG